MHLERKFISSVLRVCSVTQSCPTLCNSMDCSLPGSSAHWIFPARILEWVAISSSRVSSRFKDQTYASCLGRQILYYWATREAQFHFTYVKNETLRNLIIFFRVGERWGYLERSIRRMSGKVFLSPENSDSQDNYKISQQRSPIIITTKGEGSK